MNTETGNALKIKMFSFAQTELAGSLRKLDTTKFFDQTCPLPQHPLWNIEINIIFEMRKGKKLIKHKNTCKRGTFTRQTYAADAPIS